MTSEKSHIRIEWHARRKQRTGYFFQCK